MAKLYFYYATMNSGKSLQLLTTAHNFDEKAIPFLTMKSSKDTRDDTNFIKSRIGIKRECISIEDEDDIYESVKNYTQTNEVKWILIDECQFLEETQIDDLAKIVDLLNINVMCFGLRTDFQSKAFPASKRLFELADDIEEIALDHDAGEYAVAGGDFIKVLEELERLCHCAKSTGIPLGHRYR